MTARIGGPKTGGRRKGSLDKNARQLVTADMAADLLTVYKKLGGVKWLLKFAEDNPAEFLRQGLSRLFPAQQKDADDAGTTNNTQVNVVTDFEAARRIAFALAAGVGGDPSLAPVIDVTPTVEPTTPQPAPEPVPYLAPKAPDMPEPVEALDPARKRWIEELPLTPEQRADNALIRDTIECDITNYHGSAAEQPDASVLRPTPRQPSAGERRRAVMNRRRNDLL